MALVDLTDRWTAIYPKMREAPIGHLTVAEFLLLKRILKWADDNPRELNPFRIMSMFNADGEQMMRDIRRDDLELEWISSLESMWEKIHYVAGG